VSGTWDDPQVEFDRIFDDAQRRQVREADPNNPGASFDDASALEVDLDERAVAPANPVADPNTAAPVAPAQLPLE
jgi:hypothetical protein